MGGFERLWNAVDATARAVFSVAGARVALWFLAWVLLWSGSAKLRRPQLAALAMVDFNVTVRARPVWARTLGIFEILCAVGLATGAVTGGLAVNIAASVSGFALAIFAFVIGRALRGGERFPCYCFGESDSEISWRSLLRAAALCGLAATLALTGAPASAAEDLAEIALPAYVAGAVLFGSLLVAQIRPLWLWNRDPFGVGTAHLERRYAGE